VRDKENRGTLRRAAHVVRRHTIDHFRSRSTKWSSLRWNRVPVCVLTVITGLITGEPKHASAAEGGASTPVILISIDTLRADRLSSYGSKRPTPNIDTLAKSGTLFSAVNAAAPLTLPSHVSLFT
jgi:Sulfatase